MKTPTYKAKPSTWDKWLADKEASLVSMGYRKCDQCRQSEDFAYWKTFYEGDEKAYQVGLLFYDFRKYADRDAGANLISIQYECMILGGDRIDLSVSKDITLPEFEEMARTFYEAMAKYNQ